MHLTFCEIILKDSVGKGATQCTFDELINKRPGSIIRDVRVEIPFHSDLVLQEYGCPPYIWFRVTEIFMKN